MLSYRSTILDVRIVESGGSLKLERSLDTFDNLIALIAHYTFVLFRCINLL